MDHYVAPCRPNPHFSPSPVSYNFFLRPGVRTRLTITRDNCLGPVLDWFIIGEHLLADVIWPLLKNPKTYDILGTKDHGFIGAIGEAIAWQYLWDKGISSHALGAARSALEGVGAKDRSRLQRNLTQEQIDFIFPPLNLEEFLQHQSERSRSRGSTEEEIRQDEQHWLDLWESWTDSRDSLSWDFVGYSREWPVKKGKACLVEVKTSRSLNNQSP